MNWLISFLAFYVSSARALSLSPTRTLSVLTIVSYGFFASEGVVAEPPIAYNVIFRRDVGIEALHKFASELKKRTMSKDFPDFKVTVDKVLTNMKLIKIVNPSPAAWSWITSHKFVKEYYETPATSEL
jgi:hypothetical protein